MGQVQPKHKCTYAVTHTVCLADDAHSRSQQKYACIYENFVQLSPRLTHLISFFSPSAVGAFLLHHLHPFLFSCPICVKYFTLYVYFCLCLVLLHFCVLTCALSVCDFLCLCTPHTHHPPLALEISLAHGRTERLFSCFP